MNMKILRRGAEAILYLEKSDGRDALVKERVKKSYRIREIDEPLRKRRTRLESRIMNEARRIGVLVPQIYETDEKNFRITMEYIDGKRLKDALNDIEQKDAEKICDTVGKSVSTLHEHNIVHGDLTTSNMIMLGDKIYFIDFGLAESSNRIEDKAEDLVLFIQALKSTHYKIWNACWDSFLKGYSRYENSRDVLERAEKIQKRGRYHER
ncbi:MAG: KEOPS complex kinase/ATPase Bud32 [Candidatus Aenigmatarchaeota archaeon]